MSEYDDVLFLSFPRSGSNLVFAWFDFLDVPVNHRYDPLDDGKAIKIPGSTKLGSFGIKKTHYIRSWKGERVVFMLRDPISVMASKAKRSRNFEFGYEAIKTLLQQKTYYDMVVFYHSLNAPKLFLRYEDVIRGGSLQISRIAEFLDVDLNMEAFLRRTVKINDESRERYNNCQTRGVNDWREKLSTHQVDLLLDVVERQIKNVPNGYFEPYMKRRID